MSNVDFGIVLGLAYQRFVTELNEHLAAHGFPDVKSTFGYVFRALADGPLTTSQLAARLRITNQGMAKIINEMTLYGYVIREFNLQDAREKFLHLTDRAREALKEARAFHASFEQRLGKDGVVLRKLLTEIVERDDGSDDLARVMRPF